MSSNHKWAITALTGVLVTIVAATSAVAVTAASGESDAVSYGPIQAISYVLGSKRAVGYFSAEDGACQVTLMVAEDIDPDVAMPLSAARLRVALQPGQTVQLDSDERKFLDLTCGPGAQSILARSGDVQLETH